MRGSELMQIGEVAERTCLSLRTIRYYEEVGLVVPSERSRGGFRLYTDADVRRLWLIRRLKPLDLSLEQVRDLLEALDRADSGDADEVEAAALRASLGSFQSIARARAEALRDQLAGTEEFAADLTDRIAALGPETEPAAPRS
ncbi:MerR family transcriptional regulator [Glycomyces sp. L485]|uniref:MerR family transcriptional regulator n=1 Tax=Glycomyces sp. L485 TaxID=2909235 RepID=UPI001F4B414A|nr:MerR family transcriptional regulator [Glycomyces sp. L485]MCH7230936.1 MerR family transcriptional regulator [Glycomyces sp. L485]